MTAATLGILSIGDMGLGIAKLLSAHNFRVITNISSRRWTHGETHVLIKANSSSSQATHTRAQSVPVHLVSSDEELAAQSDYILSIVPPRDALATAKRILTAVSSPSSEKRSTPLYYLDLNAVSPSSARAMNELFKPVSSSVRFLDGGIIGGPPRLTEPSNTSGAWTVPSIPMSGPHPLAEAQPSGAQLAAVLNTQHISPEVGQASGLKMCFASLTKGFTALAIQSFTTAQRLGVLPELQDHLSRYSPKSLELARNGLKGMPPKAYRWVREMEEIGKTFADDGGFEEGEAIYAGVASTYDLVANGTELGLETTEQRRRGMDAEDVARCMSEGIDRRKVKVE